MHGREGDRMVNSRFRFRRRQIRYGSPYLAILAGYEQLHHAHDRLQWAFLALWQQLQQLQTQAQDLPQQRQADQHVQVYRALEQVQEMQVQQQELQETLLRSRAQGRSLADQLHRALSACYNAEVRARRAEQALAKQEEDYRSLAERYQSLRQLEDQLLRVRQKF